RKEIWAYGFRNPHRLNWAIDPANAANNHLIANSVGLHTWETVYIVRKGTNYGYARREGTELLKADNTTGPLPGDDRIPMQVGDTPTDSMFPVVETAYHDRGGKSPRLAGRPELVFGGRADVRFSIDAAGELYLYSKGDGVIRKVIGATGF